MMTRWLRPAVPVQVTTRDNRPVAVTRGGRRHGVTHWPANWITPASWWEENGRTERQYWKIVLDGYLVWQVYLDERGWWLERIMD